eukprot:jgi/Bigna1/91076/estExt_fgenesh1_pg.C_880003
MWRCNFRALLHVLFLLIGIKAIEIDFRLPIRYQLDIRATTRELYFNFTQPNRFFHVSFGKTIGATLYKINSHQDATANVSSLNDSSSPIPAATIDTTSLSVCNNAFGVRQYILKQCISYGKLVLTSGSTVSGRAMQGESRYFGVVATDANTPLLVKMKPARDSSSSSDQVDADLFVVNAIDATTGTTTTTSTPATALLTTGTPYYGEHEEVARISQPWSSCTTNLEAGCLYIAQVYIPRDSATLGGGGSNSRSSSFSAAVGTAFSISVEKETQDDDTGFATDLMFMSAALTILLLCVLSSALVFCRARIEVFRRRHQAEQQAALAAAQAHGEGTTQIAVARGEQRALEEKEKEGNFDKDHQFIKYAHYMYIYMVYYDEKGLDEHQQCYDSSDETALDFQIHDATTNPRT